MDKKANQIRNKAQHRLDRVAKLQEQIRGLRGEVALLEVEYEELTDQPLLSPDRTRLADLARVSSPMIG